MPLEIFSPKVAIRTLEPAYDLNYTVRKDKDEDMDKVGALFVVLLEGSLFRLTSWRNPLMINNCV